MLWSLMREPMMSTHFHQMNLSWVENREFCWASHAGQWLFPKTFWIYIFIKQKIRLTACKAWYVWELWGMDMNCTAQDHRNRVYEIFFMVNYLWSVPRGQITTETYCNFETKHLLFPSSIIYFHIRRNWATLVCI